VNGNPQRLYMVYELVQRLTDDGYEPEEWLLVEVYDEGYGGRPTELRGVSMLPAVRITQGDYHTIYMMAESAGLLRYGS